MTLYKGVIGETSLPGTKEMDSAPDSSQEALSNSEGYASLLIPLISSSSEPAMDYKDSESSSKNRDLSELGYTAFNASRDRLTMTCETEFPSSTGPDQILGTFVPENISTETTTVFVCDPGLSKQSSIMYSSSDNKSGLPGITGHCHGDKSGHDFCEEDSIKDDRHHPPGPVDVQNGHQCLSYLKSQNQRTDLENRQEHCVSSDSEKLGCKALAQNKTSSAYKYSWNTAKSTDKFRYEQVSQSNACSKDKVCDETPSNIEQRFEKIVTDEGQACNQCLHLSNQTVKTNKRTRLSDHVSTKVVKCVRKDGQKNGEDEEGDGRKDKCQEFNEHEKDKNNTSSRLDGTTDTNIQKMDSLQAESLMTKIVTDPMINIENNPALSEALARRDEMVKDLSVDGSGLKVMCCLLGVIVVFAIAIITIVATGL